MQAGKFDCALPKKISFRARWSDRHAQKVLEQDVELVRNSQHEWVVLSPVPICEQTHVYLTGATYTGNGIVCSCRREDVAYSLNIAMKGEGSFYPLRHEFDPGVLNLDDFLTEEEEAKILESLKDEMPYSGLAQRTVLRLALRLPLKARHGLDWILRKATLLFLPTAI